MEYIDLHMHSSFSDGTDTPEELVLKAKQAGIGLIALTDHNTIAGIPAFREACARHGVTGIDGVELSTSWPEERDVIGEPPEIHVLGYFPPGSDFSAPRFDALHQVIAEYRLTKIRHNEAIVRKMEEAGIRGKAPETTSCSNCQSVANDDSMSFTGNPAAAVNESNVSAGNPAAAVNGSNVSAGNPAVTVVGFNAFARSLSRSGNYNRVHIARYLVHLGVVGSIDEAMDVYIGKTCPYYVPRETITAAQAIEAIHAGGGTAVIAHTGEYHLEGTRLEAFWDYCLRHDIDGFELLHPHNTPHTAAQILRFAERFRRETGRVLLLTAGSDYHGANKLNRQALPWMPPYAWN